MSERDQQSPAPSSTGKSRRRLAKAKKMAATYAAFVAECQKRGEQDVLNEYDLWWNALRLGGERRKLRDRTMQRWSQEKARA